MNLPLLVNVLIGIYYAIFGLMIGSFLNVCIYRIPLKLSISKGNSFCTSCNHRLYPKDLVPLFSFLFLGGKCRYCKSKISFRYPLVEGLTSIAFLASFLCFGFGSFSIILSALFAILIVIAFIDYDTQIVFDRFHFIIIGLGILAAFFPLITGEKASVKLLPTLNEITDISILDRIIGLFAVSVPLVAIIYIYATFFKKEGMGGGDVKLFAALGFFLGWKLVLFALLFSSVIGAIYGVIVLIKTVNNMPDEEPEETNSDENDEDEEENNGPKFAFVPCIAIGTFIAILYGDQIINWYTSLFSL